MAESNNQGGQGPNSDNIECPACEESVPVVSLIKCGRPTCEKMMCTDCTTVGPYYDLPDRCPHCVFSILLSQLLIWMDELSDV